MHRRERNESTAAPPSFSLNCCRRVQGHGFQQLGGVFVSLGNCLQVFEVTSAASGIVILASQNRTIETEHGGELLARRFFLEYAGKHARQAAQFDLVAGPSGEPVQLLEQSFFRTRRSKLL